MSSLGFVSLPQQLVFNSVTNCLGPRKFLHSGKLYKAKSNKELYGFLFNDFLLLTQIIKPLGSSGTDKVFSPKSNLQYKMYKTVSPTLDGNIRFDAGGRRPCLKGVTIRAGFGICGTEEVRQDLGRPQARVQQLSAKVRV